MATLQKITPSLWFNDNAEEAARFYVSVFHDAKLGQISHFTEEGFETHGRPAGSVLTVAFTIEGHEFLALNGGPLFQFTEAVSFVVYCDSQKEIDYYWEKLTPGGDPDAQQCGWLKDKFGLSWQIVPSSMPEMIGDPDSAKAGRVMNALLRMHKLDMAELEQAYRG